MKEAGFVVFFLIGKLSAENGVENGFHFVKSWIIIFHIR